jgi:hypothetical protein
VKEWNGMEWNRMVEKETKGKEVQEWWWEEVVVA